MKILLVEDGIDRQKFTDAIHSVGREVYTIEVRPIQPWPHLLEFDKKPRGRRRGQRNSRRENW